MPYFKRGSEFTVNANTQGNQSTPEVFALSGGQFAVQFYDDSFVQSRSHTRVFTETGSTSGPEVASANAPAIALTDGRFLGISGERVGPLAGAGGISVQLFSSAFAAIGTPITLNNETASGQVRLASPTATALPGGGFAAVWDAVAGNGSTTIYGETFDSAGKPASPRFVVGTGTGDAPNAVTTLSDGHIAVVWNGGGHLQTSVFNADGTSANITATVDTSSSAGPPSETKIAALPGGGFAVLWDENLSANGYVNLGALHLQIFDAAGKAVAGDIIVSAAGPAQVASTDITTLSTGEIAVTWADRGPDGTSADPDIALRIYSSTGAEMGHEQIVNSTVAGPQFQPSIAALDNGGFVVSWSDLSHTGTDTNGIAVHAQIFTPDAPKTLTGDADANTLTGGLGDDTLEGRGGDDRLDGGAGYDTASYARAAAAVQVSLAIKAAQDTVGDGRDTLVSIENLTGSAFADKLAGNGGDNTIDGHNGNDIINGGAGNDHLIGSSGNDVLIGGTGDDLMEGGLGNDIYYVDSIYDRVFEAGAFDAVKNKDIGGIDTVHASVDYSLSLSALATTPFGGSTEIPNHIENLTLDGTANLSATGNALDNRIIGNAGDNLIDGGFGADRLTGGAGADSFVFSSLSVGAVDIVTDFAPGVDHIDLAHGAFAALLNHALGALTDADLALGAKATTADQHLIYNAATGALFYDADGSDAQAQVKIAVLLGHPDLHASDVIVI